ncbi:MAG TPA: hypothetical protein DEO87_07585 [Lachnospiraceae bacterium]|nr:hypothetical protein [Lachnospiraceae bacterium]
MKLKIRRHAAIFLIFAVILSSMTACSAGKKKGKKNSGDNKEVQNLYSSEYVKSTEVFKMGDETIHLDVALIYLIMEYRQYTVTEDNINSLPDVCKSQAIVSLHDTYCIYKEAMASGIVTDEEDEEMARNYADTFIQSCSEALEKCGISKETVYEEYRKQMIVEKFKHDEKNRLGQEYTEKYQKEYGDKRFFKAYVITFPTVQVDSDGMPVSNSDGSYATVTDAEKQSAYDNAVKAREEILGGADYKEVISKYGVDAYSSETTSYEGYSTTNGGEDKLEKLKKGEATEISESKLGYIFYVITDDNSTDSRDYYIQYLTNNDVNTEYDYLENKWKKSIIFDESKDTIGTAWNDIDMVSFGKMLME